ncbi:MAG: 4Fe-4S dicluster domain-containing protein, partial [Acidobacteriota bacterium]
MPEARHAFLFDGERCTGCEACRIACGMANAGGADTGWRRVLTFNPRRHPALATRHLSLACNHCDDPACLAGCPAAAYRRDPATGAVLLEQTRCLGCRYCSWVCPYDAPRFDADHGLMAKCTWCETRLRAGSEPACTQACPTGALSWGERTTAGRDAPYPGVPSTELGPALVVVPSRRPLT